MITKIEIQWLAETLPDLKINEGEDTIEGTVRFTSVYDKVTNMFTAFMDPNIDYEGLVISGEYKIKITKNSESRRMPKCWVYTDKNKWIPKRHFFDTGDGRACLAGPSEEDDIFTRGYSFLEYFERLVIPFLYAQSYFDEYKKWPWLAYDHDVVGILQSFKNSDSKEPQVLACLKRLKVSKQWNLVESVMNGQFDGRKCFCGSDRMINKCHPDLILVARSFREAIKKYGLDL